MPPQQPPGRSTRRRSSRTTREMKDGEMLLLLLLLLLLRIIINPHCAPRPIARILHLVAPKCIIISSSIIITLFIIWASSSSPFTNHQFITIVIVIVISSPRDIGTRTVGKRNNGNQGAWHLPFAAGSWGPRDNMVELLLKEVPMGSRAVLAEEGLQCVGARGQWWRLRERGNNGIKASPRGQQLLLLRGATWAGCRPAKWWRMARHRSPAPCMYA